VVTPAVAYTSYQRVSCILDDGTGTTIQYCTLSDAHNHISQKSLNANNTDHPAGMVARYNYMYAGKLGSGYAFNGFNSGSTASGLSAQYIYNNVIENVAIFGTNVTGSNGFQADFYFYNNTYYVDGTAPYSTSCIGPFVPATTSTTVSYYNNIHIRLNLVSGASTNGVTGHGDAELPAVASSLKVSNFNRWNSDDQISTGSNGFTGTVNGPFSYDTWRGQNAAHDSSSTTEDPQLSISPGGGPNQYALPPDSPCKNTGRVGGVSTGQKTDMGAWGNGASQIGSTVAS
jgi:hypothetical protein